MHKRSRLLVALLLLLALIAASCGDDDDTTESSSDDDMAEEEATDDDMADEADDDMAEEEATDDDMADEDMAEEETEEVASLLIWADENRVGPLEAIAPAFTEATGVEVTIELVDFGGIRDQMIQAGPAGEGADIFVGAHDWTGELAANGVIAPIDVSAIQDQFVQVALDGFNFEGSNYAVPYATEAIAMYRNADLVADAPATWDELVAACAAAAVEHCVTVPGGGDAPDAYHNYPFVSANGGGIFAFDASTGFDASQVLLDSDATIAGVQFLADQTAAGNISSTNYDTAKNLWLEGSAAFWITGPWELGGVREQTGVANWAVSTIPQIGDAPAQPFVGAQGFFLSAFSENSLIAQSFLVDFIASDDTMQALYDADPRGAAWGSVADAIASDPAASAFSESAANGIPMPNIPQMGAVWGPLGDNMLLVRNGEIPAADAMTTAAEAVRAAVAG